MSQRYIDFDVVITHGDAGYSLRLPGHPSPDGEPVSVPFVLPFSATELATFMVAVGPPRVTSRRLVPVTERVGDVKDLGQRLGDALLTGVVGATFRSEVEAATAAGRNVRLRLDLEGAPDLQPVPWEYLYSADLGRFLTLSNRTPIVRQVKAFGVPPPAVVHPPLRVLVMISSPSDVPALAVDRERQLLEATTKDLVDAGLLEIVVLADATLPALQRALLDPFHVFHFIGHGGFDRELDQGVLVLERDDNTSHRVTGARLGTLLHDARDLQLAVLNACEGARSSGRDAFSGVGQALVRQGLPAVVAMQTEISDRAALVFSHELYSYLTRGLGIDTAICEVRKAMATSDEASEWGTAVLLRSAGATDEPFTFVRTDLAQPDRERRWESLYAAARGALAADATSTAVPILEHLAAERPDDADVTALLERVRPTADPPAAAGAPADAPADALHWRIAPARPAAPSDPGGEGGAASDGPTAPPPSKRLDRRLLVGGAAAGLVLVAAVGFAVSRGQTPAPTPPPSTSVSPGTGASATTIAGVRTVDLPTTGEPTGALVLPYAVDGDYHSAAGTDQIGPWGALEDVLRLPGGNRVVRVDQAGRVRMTLTDQGGSTISDLGQIDSHVEANRGTRFAYVDPGDGHLRVRDNQGGEAAALPEVGAEARVVGFAGPAVFFTSNGATYRWDTTTDRPTEWRQAEMVAFNDSTRTAVGQSGTGCFAVLRVDTPSQATRNLDCDGLDLKGVTGDGRYAIAWNTPTGPEESRRWCSSTSRPASPPSPCGCRRAPASCRPATARAPCRARWCSARSRPTGATASSAAPPTARARSSPSPSRPPETLTLPALRHLAGLRVTTAQPRGMPPGPGPRHTPSGGGVGLGRGVAAVALVTVGPLDERREVEDRVVDARMQVAESGEALGHRGDGEVLGQSVGDLVPPQGGGDGATRVAPHAVGRGDRVVAGVLVVVDEQVGGRAVLAPPRRRHVVGQAPLDLTCEGQRAAPDVLETPARLDADVDVQAGPSGGLGPADRPELVEHLVRHLGGATDPVERALRHGVEVDAPLVGALGVGPAAVPGVELDGRHLDRPDDVGELGHAELVGVQSVAGEVQPHRLDPRAAHRRANASGGPWARRPPWGSGAACRGARAGH